jgi:hypothetical protein
MIPKLWIRYAVELSIANRLVGGIPTNSKLIAGWIQSNMKSADQITRDKIAEATIDALPDLVDEKAQGMWTTFKVDGTGVFLESRCIKSMLKEAANVLRPLLQQHEKNPDAKSRFTNLKSRAAERLFVEGDRIYIYRDGKPITRVDGAEERAIHVMTAQGERSALKRYDFINAPCSIRFNLKVLNDRQFDTDLVRTLFEYAGINGMGADRSQGNGIFELMSLTCLDPGGAPDPVADATVMPKRPRGRPRKNVIVPVADDVKE